MPKVSPTPLRGRWTSEFGPSFISAHESDRKIIQDLGFHVLNPSKSDTIASLDEILQKLGEPARPVVLILGFGREDRSLEKRIFHDLDPLCPVTRSYIYQMKERFDPDGTRWGGLSDIPQGDLRQFLEVDLFTVAAMWETMYCPCSRSFTTGEKLLMNGGHSDGNKQN